MPPETPCATLALFARPRACLDRPSRREDLLQRGRSGPSLTPPVWAATAASKRMPESPLFIEKRRWEPRQMATASSCRGNPENSELIKRISSDDPRYVHATCPWRASQRTAEPGTNQAAQRLDFARERNGRSTGPTSSRSGRRCNHSSKTGSARRWTPTSLTNSSKRPWRRAPKRRVRSGCAASASTLLGYRPRLKSARHS